MNLRERRIPAYGQGMRRTNAARRAPLRAAGTPRWRLARMDRSGRSGAACSAALAGAPSRARRGWAPADPLEGKRSAQASADRREGTMEAREGRDATAARCHARQRGPAMPGDAKTIQTGTPNYPMRSIWHLSADVGWLPLPAMANTYIIQRSRSDRRRRAPRRNGWARSGLAWPPSALLYAFGAEGALRPLAD